MVFSEKLLRFFTIASVRNYRSPSCHCRLTFCVGDHKKKRTKKEKNLSSRESFAKKAGRSGASMRPQKKKNEKRKNLSSRESFAKKAGRSGASILSSALPLRFDQERNMDRETPTCHAHARCYSAELCSRCFPHVRSQDRKQRDKMTPCHDTQLESRFTFLTLLRRERRQTDPERTFFLFGSIECETRIVNSHLSRACEALQRCVFSHFSFHTCGGRTKRHNNSTQKKAGGSTA